MNREKVEVGEIDQGGQARGFWDDGHNVGIVETPAVKARSLNVRIDRAPRRLPILIR